MDMLRGEWHPCRGHSMPSWPGTGLYNLSLQHACQGTSYIVLYQTSWARCINGRGGILSVTCQSIINYFEII